MELNVLLDVVVEVVGEGWKMERVEERGWLYIDSEACHTSGANEDFAQCHPK